MRSEDAVTPELVLVDPALGERARSRLGEPNDTLARVDAPIHRRLVRTQFLLLIAALTATIALVQAPASRIPPVTIATSSLVPYSASSIWRSRIQSNPRLDANNSERLGHWLANSVRHPNISLRSWGVAVAIAQPDSPRYTVRSTTGWANTINALGPVPIPYGTKPDPSSDGHLAIYDPATNREYGMWQASYNAATDTWSAGGGQAGSTTTDGIAPAGTAGADAANFPLLGGLLRPEEIEAGVIEHALVFAMPGASTGFVCPATHGTGKSFKPIALQAGSHMQLDPRLDVDALSLTAWETVVAKALQEYGMYLRDSGGSLSIYAENVVNRGQTPNQWSRLGFDDRLMFSAAFPWHRMRILAPTPC
jgi:hypothetical protein